MSEHQHATHTVETPESIVKKLDVDEMIRMENLLLKEQIEKMFVRLEEMRTKASAESLAKNRTKFQEYLNKKHGVDIKTHQLSIDVQKGLLTIIPHGE